MQIQTQFSIFLVNKPGVLAAVTGAMAKARINIVALTLMDFWFLCPRTILLDGGRVLKDGAPVAYKGK